MKVKYPENIRMYFLLTEMLYLCGYTFLCRYPLKKKKIHITLAQASKSFHKENMPSSSD